MSSPVTELEELKAKWSTAAINNLPDSAFLYIEPGGSKDSSGKTTPRSLRHFPVRDASGKLDIPHLRNALSRIPQSGLPAGVKSRLAAEAQRLLESTKAASSVQSVLIPRSKFSLEQARAWIKDHGYHQTKVDVTDAYYRFRQADPGSFSQLRTKEIGRGIKLIIGF